VTGIVRGNELKKMDVPMDVPLFFTPYSFLSIDPTRNLSFHSLDQKSLGTFLENPAQHVAAALREWKDSWVNARIVHGGVLLCLVALG